MIFNFWTISDARSMAKDVHNIIVKVVMEKGQMTNSQALNYVKKMEQQKRYSADVWSWFITLLQTLFLYKCTMLNNFVKKHFKNNSFTKKKKIVTTKMEEMWASYLF